MREIDDREYIECLPTSVYQRHYYKWRERMLSQIDNIALALQQYTLPQVMEGYHLTPRDIALLVRLKYFTAEEIDAFGLREIEEAVPV